MRTRSAARAPPLWRELKVRSTLQTCNLQTHSPPVRFCTWNKPGRCERLLVQCPHMTLVPAEERGLSFQEAAKRLREEGPNRLPQDRATPWWRTLLGVVREPMLLLLLSCGVLYMVLGNRSEAVVLFGFVWVVIGMTWWQERRTEHALQALKKLAAPRARVLREGTIHVIPSEQVVRGDWLVVSEGDHLVADGFLLQGGPLFVDESLLTGESVPVYKDASVPSLFAGSLVVRGQGILQVTHTGAATEMGKIGVSLVHITPEKTPLQRQIHRMVYGMAGISVLLCVGLFLLNGLLRGHWVEALLFALALAMSMLPEELPMILTIFFALGALRISKHNVLVRRGDAMEALGSASVLCVDKTGTLTWNHMRVVSVRTTGAQWMPGTAPIPSEVQQLIQYGCWASSPETVEPMEQALRDVQREMSLLSPDEQLVHGYPWSPQTRCMAQFWKNSASQTTFAALKGAPEAVVELCGLSEDEKKKWREVAKNMAEGGLRLLAVAACPEWSLSFPSTLQEIPWVWLGLVGFEDPVRSEAKEAVAACHQAGIRVLMMTGDHPGTAAQVACQVGLPVEAGVLTGADLDVSTEEQLKEKISTVHVFSRVTPQNKLQLVRALQELGHVVAVTGDGVNDAPALKAAHIGIAMGQRGTDAAREAASVILLDDNIGSWVKAIQMGRRMYDNIQNAVAYTLAIHVTIAGLAILPLVLGFPPLLLPAHIALLEMVIDPACSLVFESDPAQVGTLRRPPRPKHASLLSPKAWVGVLLEGGLVLAACLGIVLWTRHHQLVPVVQRTMGFVTLLFANLGLIAVNRMQGSLTRAYKRLTQPLFLLLCGGVILATTVLLWVPPLQRLFQWSHLSWKQVAVCVGTSLFTTLLAYGVRRVTHASITTETGFQT